MLFVFRNICTSLNCCLLASSGKGIRRKEKKQQLRAKEVEFTFLPGDKESMKRQLGLLIFLTY